MVTGRPSIYGLLEISGLGNEFQRSLDVSSSSWSACVSGGGRERFYISWLFAGLVESQETEGDEMH
jgi:hypothetical protein